MSGETLHFSCSGTVGQLEIAIKYFYLLENY
jgi:hypothetical protein